MSDKKTDCPFCNFQDSRKQKIYEDEYVYAVLSDNPINRYHVLVIPINHYESLSTLPNEVACQIITTVQKLSMAVRKSASADAITYITEDDVTGKGYNMVKHFKFHIIPRYSKDMDLMNWKPLRINLSDVEIQSIATEIRSKL
jgi:histidine triad (HIT) family protein